MWTFVLAGGLFALAGCEDDNGNDPVDPVTGPTGEAVVTAYVDANEDGDFDPGVDSPVVGANVTLAGGDFTYTAKTDSTGTATFEEVVVGAYTVGVDVPNGIRFQVEGGGTQQITVAEGSPASASFSYQYLQSSIEGFVYDDANLDTAYFAGDGDQVAAGVTIELYADSTMTGAPLATTTTDAEGRFNFPDLNAGTYTVRVVGGDAYTNIGTGTQVVHLPGGTRLTGEFAVFPAVLDIERALALANDGRTDSMSVAVRGIVTAGRGTISTAYYWIGDESGGAKVYVGSASTTPDVQVGDSVIVRGLAYRFVTDDDPLGEFEIDVAADPNGDVTVLGTGTVPDPIVLTVPEANSRDFEGALARVEEVTVTSVGSGSSYNVVLEDADGEEIVVRVDSDAGITPGLFLTGQTYNVTGVLGQFNGDAQLYPRGDGDIELVL